MLVIQHNCNKAYSITIAAIETGLALNAAFICLQEPYIGKEFTISHPGYELRWPEKGTRKEKRVLIAIKKDILANIVIENRSDLIDHPYFLAIDIWDLSSKKQKIRRTRLINCYDQKIGPGTTYQDSEISRRAIQDIDWSLLLNGRAVLLGDFNAHSQYWNPLITKTDSQNSVYLEEIIDNFNLILNNELGIITRPNSGVNKSIIDLTFTTPELGLLEAWVIDEEYSTPSDHELIIFNWEDIEDNKSINHNSKQVTGWDIDKLIQDPDQLKKAEMEWLKLTENRVFVNNLTTKEEIEEEVLFIENALIRILNNNAKTLRITAYSKRWWNDKVKEARIKFSACRREFKNSLRDNFTLKRLKAARNNYYYIIRKEKQKCWQAFLEGDDDINDKNVNKDKNRCWTALKYTSPRISSNTPAMKASNGSIATTIEEKEAVFLNSAFPKPIILNNTAEFELDNEISNIDIKEKDIETAIFQQSVKKAPGPDKLNFKAIRLLWSWDKNRIKALITQCFNRGYHPQNWKIAKGIILAKPNKPDKSVPKAYRVISLLNCLGKVVEKLAATFIANFCEENDALHNGQFSYRKSRSTIDAVAELIYTTEKAWQEKRQLGALFMDVKGAFDYVNKNQLLKRMKELKIPNYLINWTNSFLIERKVQLIIDNFTCPIREISTGVPQGSPVSPILFLIYLSGIFEKIESELPIKALSFADDIAFLASDKEVENIQILLTQAGEKAIEWGLLNNVSFDINKTEAVLFTKNRKILRKIKDYKMTINSHEIGFNLKATRWLGIWLDSSLSFKEHYQTCFIKAKQAVKRLKSISKTHGLAAGLVRRVQIALVQSIALYGAEIWWKGQKQAAEKLQTIINSQARAILGVFSTSPVDLIVENAIISPAESLLDDKQRKYAFRGLKQAVSEPLNSLLPPTLRYGDEMAQPGDFSEYNLQWADYNINAKMRNLSQRLAKKLTFGLNFDDSKGFEIAHKVENRLFHGEITILNREKAIEEAQEANSMSFTLWTDGSRLETGKCGAAITFQNPNGEWQGKGIAIGDRKEVFDAELIAIFEALKIAKKEAQKRDFNHKKITIFCDSQQAIKRCQNDEKGSGQDLAIKIIAETDSLIGLGLLINLKWVPAHKDIIGNEKADKLAKIAANKPKDTHVDGYSSFSYTNRQIREEKKNSIRKWLFKKRKEREKSETTAERPLFKLNKTLFSVKKSISSRFFQLKIGHAVTAQYLHRVKKLDNKNCWFCSNRNQTVEHLIFECNRWKKERKELLHQLAKKGLAQPRIKDKKAKDCLFEEPKAIEAILAFIEKTEIGQRPKNSREEEEDLDAILGDWGIN